MGLLADFAYGILVMTVIWLSLNTITCLVQAYTWLIPFFLLILLIPASMIVHELQRFLNKKQSASRLDRLKRILIASYGVCFASWAFDVGLTYYAINMMGVASELNPLGWPLGAVGALIFFVPAFVFAYFLSFRMKQKHSILAALIITTLSLYVGFMNFIAAGRNFSLILTFLAPPSLAMYVYLFSIAVVVDAVYAFAFVKLTRLQFLKKPSPYTIATTLICLALIFGIVQPAYNFIESHRQEGQPSFELSRFYVAYTYSAVEIRNNGSATADNVVVTVHFLRRLNASLGYQTLAGTGGGTIREIRVGERVVLTLSMGRYYMETTFPNTNVTDFGAEVLVSCVHEGSEIRASFELESLEVIPPV